MTVLSILHNELPRLAISTAASTEHADFPHENLFHGGSTIYWKSASTTTQSLFTIDLGSGNERGCDFIAVRGLKQLYSQTPGTVDLQLRASTDNFSVSDIEILRDSDILESELIGNYNEDFVIKGSLSSSYRYWRVKLVTTNLVVQSMRKVYFGESFNFSNRSPSYPFTNSLITDNNRQFVSDGGTIFKTSSGRGREEKQLFWKGISDDILNSFRDDIERYLSDYPIFLYSPDSFDHYVLKNNLLFGWANTEVRSGGVWKDQNQISMNFVEDLIR